MMVQLVYSVICDGTVGIQGDCVMVQLVYKVIV